MREYNLSADMTTNEITLRIWKFSTWIKPS